MQTHQYNLAVSRLNGRLYTPYQHDGVKWLLSMEAQASGPKGGFLCDEMGLGKSVQLIATMLGNPQPRTLIIVPKSIISQWKNEIQVFAPQLDVHVFDGPNRKLEPASVTIAPYSVLSARGTKLDAMTPLHHIQWNRVILDEAHEIRNRKSKNFKNINRLRSEIRWLVTGTPVYNSLNDFISLCLFLGLDQNFVQYKHTEIKDIYILRRTKQDLALHNTRLQLPPCHFENVELDMYEEEKGLYQQVFLEAQGTIKEACKSTSSYKNMIILECLLRARQCMVLPQLYFDGVAAKNNVEAPKWTGRNKKMETLFGMIEQHPTEKSLIFCQFRGEMNFIQAHFFGRRHVFRLDGSFTKEGRVAQIESFKNSPDGSIFVIQIKSGGVGLNLQDATRVYITTPSWNPATELQAIGRSHRMGQNRVVHVKKFIYRACPRFISVEEEMMKLQGHKSIICSEVLNDARLKTQIATGGREPSAKISIIDIKKIFQL